MGKPDNSKIIKKKIDIGIIFDMDGVIIDTCILHEKSWYTVSRLYGLQWPGGINFKNDIFGTSSIDSAKLLFKENLSHNDLINICRKKCEIYEGLLHQNIDKIIINGFLPFFEMINQLNIPVVLATSSTLVEASFVLKHLGILKDFKNIITISDIDKPKPHPQIYLMANEVLGLPVGRSVGFEDSLPGIKSLEKAGINCIVVGSSLSKERVINSCMKYKLYIRNFNQITIENIISMSNLECQ